MTRILRFTVVVATVLLLATGLHAQTEAPKIPDRVASFKISWPKPKVEAVAARAHAIAEAITGQALPHRAVVMPIKSASGGRRATVSIPEVPGFDIRYLFDYDELNITDTELAVSTASQGEFSEQDALKVARHLFDELARRKLVDPEHYVWDNADVASTWIGGGSLDGKSVMRKRIEYRITLRRAINGIELANAGMRIAVHPSGRVSGLRLGGVSVASKIAGEVEEPTGNGRWLSPKVTIADLQARFERDVAAQKAKAKVAWSRVMYVLPDNKRSAVITPMHVVSYSLEVPSDDGVMVVSRRKTIGYSLFDPNAPTVDLTPPVHKPVMDKASKQQAK